MAKKMNGRKFWIYGEDEELVARFTGFLDAFLRIKRAEYLRNLSRMTAHELSYEANSDYIEHLSTNLQDRIEDSVEAKLMWEAIRNYLYTLTPKECEVMISIYVERLSESETAKKLNVKANTVSTHKRNALAKIHKAMEVKYNG